MTKNRGLFLLVFTCVILLMPPDGWSKELSDRPSIGIALGSGGAAGLSHIAMLQVFDDHGLRPTHIAGTSIGAVIGAMYAGGLSAEEILDIFADFGGSTLDALSGLAGNPELEMLEFIQLGLGGGGVFDSGNFLEYIAGHMPVSSFEELSVPLSVVATDYWTGESVVFSEGDLFTAIEASMAVPALFEAVEYGDMLLIDGGTSNPVPFDLLADKVDIVVAVDVSGRREPVEDEDRPGMVDMLFKTMEIMQQSIVAEKLRTAEPDIYLQPQLENIRLLHFNKVHEIMEQAAPTAEQLRAQLFQ